MEMDLVEALAADGLVCLVGAGGKKTTLYTLANRLEQAVVTATVRIPIFDKQVARVAVTDDPDGEIADCEDWPLGVVPERDSESRYLGYDPEVVAALADADTDAVLVKADGARTSWLKCPNEHEPQVPTTADTVLPIASARVVGRPLDEEFVHRPERVASVTGLDIGEEVGPGDVAGVLTSVDGGLKSVPAGATVVPVVNMVDTPALRDTATEIAETALARTDRFERVALTRMDRGELVGVVS